MGCGQRMGKEEQNIITPRALVTHRGVWPHLKRRCDMDTLSPHTHKRNLKYAIYALIDPRDNAVRYIGLTNDVYDRFKQHIRCEGVNKQKDAWIKELHEEQQMVIMKTLERVRTYAQAAEREVDWINHFINAGASLLNIASMPKPAGKTKTRKWHFLKEDLPRVTFTLEGDLTVYDAATATAEKFSEKALQHANIENDIDWTMPGQRSYFLTKLWQFCEQNNFLFPYTVQEKPCS